MAASLGICLHWNSVAYCSYFCRSAVPSCVTANVGSSTNSSSKTIKIPSGYICPASVASCSDFTITSSGYVETGGLGHSCWLDTGGDATEVFTVTQNTSARTVTVLRRGGWSRDLSFRCCKGTAARIHLLRLFACGQCSLLHAGLLVWLLSLAGCGLAACPAGYTLERNTGKSDQGDTCRGAYIRPTQSISCSLASFRTALQSP